MQVLKNIKLSEYTTLKIGGVVENFYVVENEEELRSLPSGDIKILGGGSNILVSDENLDFDVVQLSGGFKKIKISGETITAGAGANFAKLLQEAANNGLSGLEIFAGIPGTVGGAVFGKITTKYGKIIDYIEAVKYCGNIIVEVMFHLKKGETTEIQARMKNILQEKVTSQPYGENSAGCVFRNQGNVSSGKLIDEAGLKGTKIGKVKISEKHANFFVVEAGASFVDFMALIDLVKNKLKLELEIEIWK